MQKFETVHPSFREFLTTWDCCRDCYLGEFQIKSKDKRYLPKPEQQDIADYNQYLNRAVFHGYLQTIVHGRVGQVMRRPPQYDFDDNFSGWQRSVTSRDQSLSEVIKTGLEEVVKGGRVGFLLDRPEDGGDLNLVIYKAEDIRNWDEEGGRLTELIVSEPYIEEEIDGDSYLGKQYKVQYRVLSIEEGYYTVKIYRKDENDYRLWSEQIPTAFGDPLDFIPFVCINTSDASMDVSKPSLLDLALMNIAHYRNSADREQLLHCLAIPTPIARGIKDDEVPTSLGPRELWTFSDPSASVQLLEFSGAGDNSLRGAMEEKVEAMASLGGKLVQGTRSSVETAETARIRSASENSTLETIVTSVEKGFTRILEYTALWNNWGIDPTLELNRD